MTIAVNTYRESARGKLIYSTVLAACIMVCAAMCFGLVTIGDPIRLAKDFSLFAISVSVVIFIVVSGTTHLHKELAKKTVFNILSKAVDRWQFILGKYLGMVFTSWVMVIIMGAGLSGVMYIAEGRFDAQLLLAYSFILMEVTVVCALAIMFSSGLVTPALAGLLTTGIFLAGRSIDYLLYFVERGEASHALRTLLVVLYWILPNLSDLSIREQLVYGVTIPYEYIILSAVYSVSYSILLLSIACIFFRRREFL